MPVKNKARPTQSGFEGEIVGLTDAEKAIIKEEVEDCQGVINTEL